MLRRFIIHTLLYIAYTQANAHVVINELMQSNIDCIMDELNDFPDSWVELYNSSDVAVNLAGYKLGISSDAKTAWALPDRELQPGGHVLICCDKVGSNEGAGIHTDFRLESGKGGSVFLFYGEEIIDQQTELKKQPTPNIAYGRETDGSDIWGYMLTPTPGGSNGGGISNSILDLPIFSANGCVMQEGESLTLNITVPKSSPHGTLIRYTTDGSEPTAESPAFTAPITVNSNTVVRAKLFCDGWLSPRSSVQSYIFFPNDRPLTLPVVSLVTDSRYLYDDKIGIYVEGSYSGEQFNYQYDWRRPANFEFFEDMGQPCALSQLTEVRIGGAVSRGRERKTLVIYANKRFGEKRLKYEFFPDQRSGVTDFKSLMLRNAGNDFNYLYMRDAIIQRTMASHVDLDWQAWRPAIVYINGEYTGLLNIRERANEDNVYTHYDGLEDIDMIESWYELKKGTWNNFMAFRNFYAEEGHTLAEYQQWMDCEEFANLLIMNLYFDNRDFPSGNIVMWRPREDGGKWRWIAKDTDFGLGLYNHVATYNTIAWINDPNYDMESSWANTPGATMLFRHLMDDEGFRNLFTERAAIYMGDFLNERGVHAVWDPMYEAIKTELPFHHALINRYYTYDKEMEWVKNWLLLRTELFYRYLQEYYHLEPLIPFVIAKSGEETEPAEILFNGIRLSEGIFDGYFFCHREVTLQGSTSDGDGVAGWEVTVESESGDKSTSIIPGDSYVFSMPECSKITVCPLIGDYNDITSLDADMKTSNGTSGVWFTLDGRRLGGKPSRSGIYIYNGKKVFNH